MNGLPFSFVRPNKSADTQICICIIYIHINSCIFIYRVSGTLRRFYKLCCIWCVHWVYGWAIVKKMPLGLLLCRSLHSCSFALITLFLFLSRFRFGSVFLFCSVGWLVCAFVYSFRSSTIRKISCWFDVSLSLLFCGSECTHILNSNFLVWIIFRHKIKHRQQRTYKHSAMKRYLGSLHVCSKSPSRINALLIMFCSLLPK